VSVITDHTPRAESSFGSAERHKSPPDALAPNQWYPLAALVEITGHDARTTLLGEPVNYGFAQDAPDCSAWRDDGSRLPVRYDFGYLWVCLGEPPSRLFDEPVAAEPDRRMFNACTLGIYTSAPRAVENFIDMGHLPLIHAGLLGQMPYSEIIDYELKVSEHEIVASHCLIYQPKASAAATAGAMVDYTFRVPHPTCAFLYKSSPAHESRLDVAGLFCQPMQHDAIRVHLWDARLDDANDDTSIRRFGQTIIAQDRPVLENQVPKELPLTGLESPVRSDSCGTAYRRWLYEMGWSYGVLR